MKAFSKESSYQKHGDKIINFTVHSSLQPKEVLSNCSERAKLAEIYGSVLDELIEAHESVQVDEGNLRRLEINEGACLGSSLDFISKVLDEVSVRGSYLSVVEKVSNHFVNHTTKKAIATQIVYVAQNAEEQHRQIEEYRSRTGVELQQIRNSLDAVPAPDAVNLVAEKMKEVRVRFNNFVQKVELQRFTPLAKFHKMSLTPKVAFDERDCEVQQKIQMGLDKLERGVYLVIYHNVRHAMVYVKESKNTGYIFDINEGTFAVDSPSEHASSLLGSAKVYNKGNGHSPFFIYQANRVS